MFSISVEIVGKPEHAAALQEALLEQGSNSLAKEPGCLLFEVAVDPENPARFFLYEVYRDAAAFEDHQKTPHFAAYRAKTGPMLVDRKRTSWTPVKTARTSK
ncbi:MAG: antibiotic biosynthesis monooxygenase [Alphaproteobacteria bacterium]|nr:antibiotic biosynthesis monooxygenase [Alphaproteobacteria bacterium]